MDRSRSLPFQSKNLCTVWHTKRGNIKCCTTNKLRKPLNENKLSIFVNDGEVGAMARSSIIATPTQLAALLKRLRLDHALTQKQLGEKMGLSQERISVIESHPEKLSIDQFLTVLMVLDARMEIRTGNSAVADTGNDEAEPW